MSILREDLINDLIEKTKDNINYAVQFQTNSLAVLNYKESVEKWSALECIEHLNRYGDFYLPEIQKRLKDAKVSETPYFKHGLIGNYFAKALAPGQKSMKTLKDMNPASSSQLKIEKLDKFIQQQKQMLDLLHQARRYNLTKVKTSISISKILKLRLGDTFKVVIYHNQRHIDQARRAIENVG